MSTIAEINSFLMENNGVITSENADQLGINRYYLATLTKDGGLERVQRGVYINPALMEDEMLTYQYKFSKGIYSYNTALYIHGLTDRTPARFDMTFPANYHSQNIAKLNIRFYTQSDKYYSLGIEECLSPNGNRILVYSIEKTLCDLIRGKNKKDPELISMAFKGYLISPNKNITLLLEMAKKMQVEKQIRMYLEVLQ